MTSDEPHTAGHRAAVHGPRSVTPLLVALLFVAFFLRVWQLTGVPPGLTHDEANHGREAIGILNGIYLYFFPLNYGSEPLYSYTVALMMAALGRGLLALRLVNAFFGTLAIAMTYAWASKRFGRAVALLGAALMAVGFWPLASSREALRAGMLPFFMTLAVWFFWRILDAAREAPKKGDGVSLWSVVSLPVIGFGLALALTLHIYLAARTSWLLFPVFLFYLAMMKREVFERAWRPVLAGLLLAAVLVAPMFLYLRAHPEMQTRLDMLDRPLQALRSGDFGPVILNVRDAFLAFVWPGFGDQFLAYNVPGRPVFDAIPAVLLVLGLSICLLRWRKPVYAFLLLWFLTGIIPSLVTGPTANTTRNLAALPAVYLIAGLGFVMPIRALAADPRRTERSGARRVAAPAAFVLVLWVAFVSARDYFFRWGDSAAVRGAYQHTLVEELKHVAQNYPEGTPILFSSVYPGPAHDPSIALVLGDNPSIAERARWVDARYSLVIPPGETLAVIPDSTPPHPAFVPVLESLETVDLRPDDLDPRFSVYILPGEAGSVLAAGGALQSPANFNGAVELVAARWLQSAAQPGARADLMTVWRVLDPARAGPLVPPSFTTDAVMFTHVLDEDGNRVAQRDALDAPSWAWQSGDRIVQIHPIAVPESLAPGDYRAVTGLYDRTSGARLPVVGGGDSVELPPLVVAP